MDIKSRLVALVLLPALSLFASDALAGKTVFDPAAKYAPSAELSLGNGVLADGVIKKCTTGTLIRNFNPFISGGGDPVALSETFVIDGEEVVLTVTWDPTDNSFVYQLGDVDSDGNVIGKAGLMYEIGVENNSEKFIYKYNDPVLSDENLNVLLAGGTSEKVNHLDACITPADAVAPDVSIRVVPSDGDIIFGDVEVIITVFDASLPTSSDIVFTIVSEDGTDYTPLGGPDVGGCTPPADDCIEFTYSWNTGLVPPGTFTLTAIVTDTSVLQNEITVTKTVEVITAAVNCSEGEFDGVPVGQFGEILGCNPSGFQYVELPKELFFPENEYLLEGKTLTQVAAPAWPSAQTDECGGPIDPATGERPFPYSALDPRWVEIPGSDPVAYVYDPSQPALDPALFEVRADTRGEKCIAFLYGEGNFSFQDFYNGTVSLFGANRYTYVVTPLPESADLGLNIPPEVGPLGENGQIDLQKVPEATYSPTNRFLQTFIGNQLGPFTIDVFNPPRAAIPDFSGFVLGSVQICESLLGSGLSPSDGRPYYEAVLECSTDLAIEYFDDLDTLLLYVGEPDPTFPAHPAGYPDNRCLKDPSSENLRVELNKARSMINVGDWTKATARLGDLLLDAEQAEWFVDDRNCPGHVLMRIKNLLWRTSQLEDAESYLPLP